MLQNLCTQINTKRLEKLTDSIILIYDNVPCGPQISVPDKCYMMEGAQTSCIQPGLITTQFSCLWTIMKSP